MTQATNPAPKTYFHCAPVLLAPGSIIEPGNWGRVVRTYRTPSTALPQNLAVAYREALLEAVRKRVAPEKPSRMACLFACPTAEELDMFIGAGRPIDVRYEVAPIDIPAIHSGGHDLPLLNITDGVPYFDTFEARAVEYWTAPPPPQRVEVLIGGPVRVIRRL